MQFAVPVIVSTFSWLGTGIGTVSWVWDFFRLFAVTWCIMNVGRLIRLYALVCMFDFDSAIYTPSGHRPIALSFCWVRRPVGVEVVFFGLADAEFLSIDPLVAFIGIKLML